MENQIIIALGREFGSGGHEAGQKLADRFGIKFLDHYLLQTIADEKIVKLLEEIHKGLNDKDLDLFLLSKVNDFKLKGEILYSKSPLERTEECINNIKTDLQNSRIEISKSKIDEDEDEKIYMIPNSIGVTKAITSLTVDGKQLLVPFDKEQ